MELIALGLMMGFTFAAPPGIVVAETMRRGLTHGFPAALGVQLGSLIGDAFYAILALAGLALLVQNATAQLILGAAGAAYIIYQALKGIRQALASAAGSAAPAMLTAPRQSPFMAGATLSLTNPWAIGYWIGPGGALATSGAAGSAGSATVFFLSFFSVCAVYAVVMALIAGLTHRAVSPRVNRLIALGCSVLMLALGLGIGVRVFSLLAGA